MKLGHHIGGIREAVHDCFFRFGEWIGTPKCFSFSLRLSLSLSFSLLIRLSVFAQLSKHISLTVADTLWWAAARFCELHFR